MQPTAYSSECAVLFADLVGSTPLYERIGDSAAYAMVDRCLKIMQHEVVSAGGRVIKNTGDGLMAAFWDSDGAADATLAMQREIRDLPMVSNLGLGIRVAFNYGPVVENGSDIFGETVNVAARLCELASPGKAMTSTDTAKRLSDAWQALVRHLPPRVLKGVSRPVELCEFVCDRLEEITAVGGDLVEEMLQAELRLYFDDRSWVLGGDTTRLRIRIGRDPTADIRVDETLASRRHCEIEQRGDKFVLIDRSSNGTFVTFEGDREFILHREEVVLRGHGWLAFGTSFSGAADKVEFYST